MIGHWLLQLGAMNPEAEDRILTGHMRPGSYDEIPDAGPCLVGTANNGAPGLVSCLPASGWSTNPGILHGTARVPCQIKPGDPCVEARYDALCARFGTASVNAAIRNRILRNRAQRTLGPVFGAPAVSCEAGLGLVESTK